MLDYFKEYTQKQAAILSKIDDAAIESLVVALVGCFQQKTSVYICGNGGSAGNSEHIVNDFVYGVLQQRGLGLRATALSANSAVITCLANDIGYENIYAHQLEVFADPGDVLLVLSGSGNSRNVVNAIHAGNKLGMSTYGILGYEGGLCKNIVQHCLHIPCHDMQICEDIQLIIGHIISREICKRINH